MKPNRLTAVLLGLIVAASPVIFAKVKKIKKIKPADNPPEFVAFSRPLDKDQQFHHALDRLTFGPRPADFAWIQQIGIQKFIDLELNPEKVPENPLLLDRLKPFETIRLSTRDLYTHYPSNAMINAYARGKGKLPDDPDVRAIVVYLADRYLERRKANDAAPPVAPNAANTTPSNAQKAVDKAPEVTDPNDDSDLDMKIKLSQILTPAQIDTLRNGKPEEKRQLLQSIAAFPPAKMMDFVWALHRKERQPLFNLAPVTLRRQLILYTSPQQVVQSDLVESKLLRAIYGNRQLQELMVDFWYNHFNVFIDKGAERYLVPAYEREAIRPYSLAKFSDLLLAVAKSPAMLFYLDNFQSVAPDSQPGPLKPNQPKRGLNENYGRELLELHTLGVDGGYTQKDVIEVARCFTGWTISGPRKGDTFLYNDKVHDKGKKVVLGHIIPPGGGMNDGLKVLDILVHHPSTAHFISLKLAKRFVADNPPPSLVNRMADTFTETNGDIREVMRAMLVSPEFWSQGAYQAKMKTPFEMIASAVRATNADVDSAYLLAGEINRLGEPLYRKIEPTGYSSANVEWVSSAGLLERMNFALNLANNRVSGVKVNTEQWANMTQQDPMNLARYLLEQDPTEQTRAAIEKTLNNPDLQKQLAATSKAGLAPVPSLVAGLVMGSPEFQRR